MAPALARTLAALCVLAVPACVEGTPAGASHNDATTESMADGDVEAPAGSELATTYDFIVSELNLYYPEGLTASTEEATNPCGLDLQTDNSVYEPLNIEGLEVDGFDLDGADTAGDGPCAHNDFHSGDGRSGIDFAFIHVIDQIRPARPGQTIEVVLESAPAQGLVRIAMRVSGVDDLVNDDEVEVLVTTTIDGPMLGTDGRIIAGSSVTSHADPAFRSYFTGEIRDGVLTAGPGDVTVGEVNFLVVEDRVIRLKDAMVRATFAQRPNGLWDADAVLAGWWRREDIVHAIGEAILAIGSNPGELECVLDAHLDHATDGETCDAMSMMFRVRAVSGFITGLEPQDGGP
ncbi:MAG: hypothetical protein ACPGU1_10050 [Myxococcota bacterium]